MYSLFFTEDKATAQLKSRVIQTAKLKSRALATTQALRWRAEAASEQKQMADQQSHDYIISSAQSSVWRKWKTTLPPGENVMIY